MLGDRHFAARLNRRRYDAIQSADISRCASRASSDPGASPGRAISTGRLNSKVELHTLQKYVWIKRGRQGLLQKKL
jgi:hypothetical protein